MVPMTPVTIAILPAAISSPQPSFFFSSGSAVRGATSLEPASGGGGGCCLGGSTCPPVPAVALRLSSSACSSAALCSEVCGLPAGGDPAVLAVLAVLAGVAVIGLLSNPEGALLGSVRNLARAAALFFSIVAM